MTKTLELTLDLLARESITPEDKGCQDLLISRLEPLGFTIERMRFGDVDNFYARRGSDAPILVFAGHTDVVPTGPLRSGIRHHLNLPLKTVCSMLAVQLI